MPNQRTGASSPHPVGRNPQVNRIAPRYAFEARILIHVQRGEHSRVLNGWARDISESGTCAFVAEELRPNESVTLTIPMPKSEALVVAARVAGTLGTQYGFQFLAVSAEQRALIQSATAGRQPLANR